MANFSSFHVLFLVFITSGLAVSATVFTLQNSCPYTVWPGTFSDSNKLEGGLELTSGASVQLTLTSPPGWTGRFWARTGCNFDSSGNGNCVTGNCGGGLKCTGTGVPPVTLAEFTIQGDGGKDFYDVSLVDGFNVKLGIKPQGGSGECKDAACVADVNAVCPDQLKVNDNGNVVACKSACVAFNTEEYCCTGAHERRGTCFPSNFSMVFKNACPNAYSYAHDDPSSTFTCTGANYLITFCP
ncbi:hypothetical protein AALP_AA2G192300 [Arabis alpina]|uniref:Pathogenesis-related protein 5-like n=1 Tax=Arabis alpina TaxID=50452 RepID=A0A087HIJ1_ARAAL|nr:hypothetical protein AALP_AA2G192300 [Arabis alpina]